MYKVDLSQYEDSTVEADIYSVRSLLDELRSEQNPHTYTVIEYFPRNNNSDYKPRIYEIINLVITDIEANTVICDGYLEAEDSMLFDNMIDNDISYNLNVFLIESIIMIGINKCKITITFDSGYIQILY
jgi:hypothetical protein